MPIRVCLDAGHYGKYNQSPGVKAYYESDMTWKLHQYLKAELESYGISVITTRNNQDTDRGLYERGAASKGCNLFLSIHSNAVGSGANERVDYPVVYVLLNGKSTEIGLDLAKVVQTTMRTSQSARTATRQGTNGEFYGVLRGANAVGTPALILEHSFHTNTKMAQWLLNEDNLKKLAIAEAKCIAEYYGIKQSNPNKLVPYKVKVDIENLNIRIGPGTNYRKTGKYTGIGTFTIVEESDGKGATKWGLLKAYKNKRNGWVSLDYVKKV